MDKASSPRIYVSFYFSIPDSGLQKCADLFVFWWVPLNMFHKKIQRRRRHHRDGTIDNSSAGTKAACVSLIQRHVRRVKSKWIYHTTSCKGVGRMGWIPNDRFSPLYIPKSAYNDSPRIDFTMLKMSVILSAILTDINWKKWMNCIIRALIRCPCIHSSPISGLKSIVHCGAHRFQRWPVCFYLLLRFSFVFSLNTSYLFHSQILDIQSKIHETRSPWTKQTSDEISRWRPLWWWL